MQKKEIQKNNFLKQKLLKKNPSSVNIKKASYRKSRYFKISSTSNSNLFFRKRLLLFFKRKLYYYKKLKFKRMIIFKIERNNIFCTFKNNIKSKTIYSCAASRYRIKVTAKKLKHSINRVLTFFFHSIKKKLKSKNLIIKIISPKFLRIKTYYTCVRLFRRLKLSHSVKYRNILYYIPEFKSFNGCRVNKKRRKKRRRYVNVKVI